MSSFTLSMPLYITTGVRKKITHYLNINRVFNMHYQLRNQLKVMFTNEAIYKLYDCPIFTKKIAIEYVIYKPTKRRYDVMNIVAIVDKFFQDALVKAGKIEDDDYTTVPHVVGKHGGIDKDNSRVDIIIKEIANEMEE